jgi:ergothioneine biosynthesis protein EgtB
MPEASPVKWHLAHTTWFFETFVLKNYAQNYREYDAAYGYLFNSYYNSIGEMHPRPKRSLLSRPTLKEVREYREHVDHAMDSLLEESADANPDDASRIIDLTRTGLNHEQQHQELVLTDIKHGLSCNPILPAYANSQPPSSAAIDLDWLVFSDGVRRIGHDGDTFAFDNESPRHRCFVDAFSIANRPVTNREYAEFVIDGGYTTVSLWLSDGWQVVQDKRWSKPLYWETPGDTLSAFTLAGLQELDPEAPVSHVSYYEADAYARWRGVRLPSEAEWEIASETPPGAKGCMLEDATFHPTLSSPQTRCSDTPIHGMFGGVWEWTASPYTGYPGYRPSVGALGEYNGKFMSNQMVLRGGSCATAQDHIRSTYRNFFPPDARWQFSGVRLAQDAETRPRT